MPEYDLTGEQREHLYNNNVKVRAAVDKLSNLFHKNLPGREAAQAELDAALVEAIAEEGWDVEVTPS